MLRYDIDVVKGDTFTQTFRFYVTQSSYTYTATLSTGAVFAVDYDDDTRYLTVTLTAAQTQALTADTFWKLKRYSLDATPTVRTLLSGKVSLLQ